MTARGPLLSSLHCPQPSGRTSPAARRFYRLPEPREGYFRREKQLHSSAFSPQRHTRNTGRFAGRDRSLFFMNRPRTARVLRTLRKKRGKNTENTLGSPLFLPSLRRVARCPRCSRSAPHHGCSASPGARGHEAGMAARQPRLIAILSRRHHGRNIPGQRRRKPNASRALHRLLPGKTGVPGNPGNRD